MIDMQSAVENAQSGFTMWLDRGVIILILTNLGLIGRDWVKTKRRNGTMTPGRAADCLEHRDRLTKLEDKAVRNREDIVEIKADVKTLLQRVPPRHV